VKGQRYDLFFIPKIRALQVSGIREDRDGCCRPFRVPGAFLFL